MGILAFLAGSLLLLSLIILAPTYITLQKAKRLGAYLSFKEAFGVTSRRKADEDVLRALALVQKNKLPITLTIIESHKWASGNPLKCVQGLLYAKSKGLQLTFQDLAVIDLAKNLDLRIAIDLASTNHTLEIIADDVRDAAMHKLRVEYFISFKITFLTAAINPPDSEKLKSEALVKITHFIERWNGSLIDAEKIITETILDFDYWKSKHVIVQQQRLTIRPT